MLNKQTQSASKWPKTFPPLTPEQVTVSNDFLQYWHEVLPKRYGIVDKFNHNYVPKEIFDEIKPYFRMVHSTFFPVPLKYQFCNLCIGAAFTSIRGVTL